MALPRRARLALLASISLAAALIAAEVGVRLFLAPQFLIPTTARGRTAWRTQVHQRATIEGIDYELRPSVESRDRNVGIRTNAQGLRGPDVREPRPASSVRVAVLGDSVAFGLGVEEPDAWPRRLEALLRSARPDLDVEVLNFGVSGYSTREEAAVLEGRELGFEPDLVLVGYCLNDPEPVPLQGLQAFFHEPAAWQHSALLRLLARTWREREIERLGGGDYVVWLHATDGRPWREARAALERMRSLVAVRGVPLVVVVAPFLAGLEDWDTYPWRGAHERVITAAHELGFGACDLLPAFAASGRAPRDLQLDETHPTAQGHALLADEVARYLLADPARWLERSR